METNTPGSRARGRLKAGAAIAALALTLPIAAAAPAAAEKKPHANPRTLIGAKSLPGVQLIEVDFKAALGVPEPTIDTDALNNLLAQVEAQALSGQIGSDQHSIAQAVV